MSCIITLIQALCCRKNNVLLEMSCLRQLCKYVYTYVRMYTILLHPLLRTRTYVVIIALLLVRLFPGSCRCQNVLDSHMLLATDKALSIVFNIFKQLRCIEWLQWLVSSNDVSEYFKLFVLLAIISFIMPLITTSSKCVMPWYKKLD